MGLFGSLEHSVFEFVSDFDIRISNLKMPIQQIIPNRVISKPSPLDPGSLLYSVSPSFCPNSGQVNADPKGLWKDTN
jgi:hypothetical protein